MEGRICGNYPSHLSIFYTTNAPGIPKYFYLNTFSGRGKSVVVNLRYGVPNSTRFRGVPLES